MIIGRFAPSPSGPLHLGSVVAAVGSWLAARKNNGQWLLRIEDLDTPRTVIGSDKLIIHELQRLGLNWDGDILYQSTRNDAYHEALKTLQEQQLIFSCTCTRKQLKGHKVYPGYCKDTFIKKDKSALRVITSDTEISFNDKREGLCIQNLAQEAGDFVVKRKDGLFAYQLAVVVDDAYQHINQIVRGRDLLESTARQIYLQQKLNFTRPEYEHLPLVLDQNGLKLSKSDAAKPVSNEDPLKLIQFSLNFLGFHVTNRNTPEKLLQDAIEKS